GIRFRQLSPAPTTEPNRLRRTPKTTLLDCCARRQSMPATQDILALQANSRRARPCLALRAAACVQSCNAAAQIFKLDFFKSCCAHHFSEHLLVRKTGN